MFEENEFLCVSEKRKTVIYALKRAEAFGLKIRRNERDAGLRNLGIVIPYILKSVAEKANSSAKWQKNIPT